MQYFFETYGCQMNKAESAALENCLQERGWAAAAQPEAADLVVINTCSVRLTAENRAWGRISHFAALKKQRAFIMVVTGCMAERLKEAMRQKQPAIDYVLGNFQKQAFGLIIDAAAQGRVLAAVEESPRFVFASRHEESGSFKAFVPIMHGCNNFCSYCIVPYVRGREISRHPLAILAELDRMAEHQVREVTLLGQNVNSYCWQDGFSQITGDQLSGQAPDQAGGQRTAAQADLRQRLANGPLDFPGLLDWLAQSLAGRGIGRIRFVSSHPKDLSDATIAVLAAHPVFARHIHLCVQHGSDRVLAAMNRQYSVQSYRDLVARVRAQLPDVSLSTDILVGFPGETEADLEATLDLLRDLRFAYAYMYFFNPREGTPAAAMPGQLSTAVKKERLARGIELQRDISRQVMRASLGRIFPVLVESTSRKSDSEVLGRTEQDMMAVFPGEARLVGSFVNVRLDSLRGNTFKATLVS